MKMKKRFFGILPGLVMALVLMLGMSMTAYADGTPTYTISVCDHQLVNSIYDPWSNMSTEASLPYTVEGEKFLNDWDYYDSTNVSITLTSGTNISISDDGKSFTINGEGTSEIHIHCTGNAFGEELNFKFVVTKNKPANPLSYVEAQTVTKTFSTSAQTETLASATNGQGAVSYAIQSQKNSSNTNVSYFSLDGTTLTIAANTPAGTYSVVVRATAAGNEEYASGTKDSTVTVTVKKPVSFHKVNTIGVVAVAELDSVGTGCTFDEAKAWVDANNGSLDKGDITFFVYNVDGQTYNCVAMQGTNIGSYPIVSSSIFTYLTASNVVFYALYEAPASASCDDNFVLLNSDTSEDDLKKSIINSTNEQVLAFIRTLTKTATGNQYIVTGYNSGDNTYNVYRADNDQRASLTYADLMSQVSAHSDWPFYYLCKLDPTANAPTASATYGQTLAVVTLTNPTGNTPGTWAWVDSTQSVGDVVSPAATFKANFTPTDTAKYKTVEDVDVTVTVSEANAVAATVTANNRTYDGTKNPLITVDDSTLVGGEMQYALGTKDAATGEYSTSIPTATEAGTYYVWYKVIGDDNHLNTEAEYIEVTINPADSSSAVSNKALSFTGQPQPLVNAGTVSGGTLQYALGTDANTAPADGWSTEIPTATEPGTYYVWYKVVGDENHNGVDPACIVVTIAEPIPEETPAATPVAPESVSDYTLLASMKTSGEKAFKLKWTAVTGAEGYDVFFGDCGGECELKKTVTGTSCKIGKLKKGNAYKAFVKAWRTENGQKVYIGEASPDVHAVAGGKSNKYTNAKKITVKKKKLTVAVGGSKKIKASLKKFSNSRRYLNHTAKIRYFSSNRAVATVNAKGKVTGVAPGTCTVYAVAENGLRKGVKITVK